MAASLSLTQVIPSPKSYALFLARPAAAPRAAVDCPVPGRSGPPGCREIAEPGASFWKFA